MCCGKRPALRPGPPAGGFSNEKLSKLPRVSSCSKGEWMCTNTPKGTSQFLESAGPRPPPPNTHTHTESPGRVHRDGEASRQGSASHPEHPERLTEAFTLPRKQATSHTGRPSPMSKQQEIELNSRYKDANVINRTKHSLPKSGEGLGVETISYQRV